MTNSKKHVLIGINPKSGSGSGSHLVGQLVAELQKHGHSCETVADLQRLKELAFNRNADNSLRCVIACGGDGTVAAVATHIPDSVPIALFPLGTENLLARQLGTALSPQRLAKSISNGYLKKFDAAEINGELFSLMVGVGFDAEVVRRVHLQRRGHITKLAYCLPILKAIFTYRYPPITLRFYGEKIQSSYEKTGSSHYTAEVKNDTNEGFQNYDFETRWVFLVNQPRYAGEINFSPTADPHDGLIDVCCFNRGGVIHGLKYLVALWQNRIEQCNGFSLYRTTKLSLNSKSPVGYQRDGDFGGVLPAKVQVDRDRLNFVVPFKTHDRIVN